jgi:hypothetical protein
MTDNPRPRTQADVVLEPVSYFTRRTLLQVGFYPIVTFQYSSTTLYQFSCHIR